MEVTGYFESPVFRFRLVTKDDAFDHQFLMNAASPIGRYSKIMVADNPAPIVTAGQLPKQIGCLLLEPRLATVVVEIVAKAKNRIDGALAGKPRQFLQRRPAVIRRQELPAHGIA